MIIRKAVSSDVVFIYDTLKGLRGEVDYSLEYFVEYFENFMKGDNFFIYLAELDGLKIGLITVNKFSMPRYCGYGLELEEVVIVEGCRGKGMVKIFIDLLIKEFQPDTLLRKVLIKTDDRGYVSELYARLFDKTSFLVFQKKINFL